MRDTPASTSVAARLILATVLVASLTGCAAKQPAHQQGQQAPQGEGAANQPDADKASAKTPEEAAKEAERQADEYVKDARQLAKLQRDRAIAGQRVAQARLAQFHAEIQHDVAVADALQDLELERRRSEKFLEHAVPSRIKWSELSLARAGDRVQEATEELDQLEKMYAEEDFADGTKEIVLERGRRSLKRSQEDLELRRADHATLVEKTLPLEKTEHEQGVEKKTMAAEQAQLQAEAARLEKNINVMSAESELARIDSEIDALQEKMEKRRKEREEEAAAQEQAG